MACKFFFLTLIAVVVLVNVKGEDDFKEENSLEDVALETEQKMEEDELENEASAARMPRFFRSSGSRSRIRSSSGSRGFLTRRSTTRTSTTRTSGSRGFFGRRSGRTSGSRGGFFTRRTSGGGSRTRRTNTGGGGGSTWDKLGTAVDIASLGVDISSTILESIGSVERKIVVGLGNLGPVNWQGGSVFMDVGSSLEILPLELDEEEGVQLAGVKPTGVNTKGVAGCLCYGFQLIGKTFCLAFKVPYSGDNYWNIKIYDGSRKADKATFDDLMKSSPIKAGAPVARKELLATDEYKIVVKDTTMTNSGQCVLQVSVGLEE